MNNTQQLIQCEDDEIDLRELFLTLKKNKKIIILVTTLITLTAFVYVLFKNPIPEYKGTLTVEIGEVKTDNPKQTYFDNANNLKILLEQQFNVKVNIPKRTTNILLLSAENHNKSQIQKNLKKVMSYIEQRHKEKAKLYNQYIMTKQVGNIVIDNQPINLPKKKLIVTVAFVTGLIFSIFLVFFLEFIKGLKEEE